MGYEKPRNAIAVHCREDGALKQGVIDSLGREKDTTLIAGRRVQKFLKKCKKVLANGFQIRYN